MLLLIKHAKLHKYQTSMNKIERKVLTCWLWQGIHIDGLVKDPTQGYTSCEKEGSHKITQLRNSIDMLGPIQNE